MENESETRRIENSDVLRRTLISLIHVAVPKSSKDYAWSIIKSLLVELKSNYAFLKYVHIDDIESLENTIDDISVLSDMNQVNPRELGRAIQNIVDIFKTRMGKKVACFFISEFRQVLGDEYHSIIKEMGVDLRLIELQHEVFGTSDETYKIKDASDSNIAYLEKEE